MENKQKKVIPVTDNDLRVITPDPFMRALIKAEGGLSVIPRSERDYIDTGDRVVIEGEGNEFGSSDLRPHKGQHGVVLSNDGSGFCVVRLDSGVVVYAWNGADLVWEE